MINKNINANYCLAKTSVNNQNTLSYSFKHAFQNSFPSIKCNYTTTTEVENIIISLKPSNSFGYDEVPTTLLKLCYHFISSLLIMYVTGLFTGVFPNWLKDAFIRPLFKKGNKNDISNYKPISILTSFSNIFEKVMQIRLLKHLNVHNILSNEQYNFRTKLKTDSATYQLANDILNANLIGGIFCDLERHMTVLITKFLYLDLNSMA